jgi:hypothetical protein
LVLPFEISKFRSQIRGSIITLSFKWFGFELLATLDYLIKAESVRRTFA